MSPIGPETLFAVKRKPSGWHWGEQWKLETLLKRIESGDISGGTMVCLADKVGTGEGVITAAELVRWFRDESAAEMLAISLCQGVPEPSVPREKADQKAPLMIGPRFGWYWIGWTGSLCGFFLLCELYDILFPVKEEWHEGPNIPDLFGYLAVVFIATLQTGVLAFAWLVLSNTWKKNLVVSGKGALWAAYGLVSVLMLVPEFFLAGERELLRGGMGGLVFFAGFFLNPALVLVAHDLWVRRRRALASVPPPEGG